MEELNADILDNLFKEMDKYDFSSMNLSEDSELDKYALELEAEKHSHITRMWLCMLITAQKILTKKKEVLEDIEAELLLKVKQNGLPGIEKITDSVASAWITIQPKFKVARRNKRIAENNVSYLTSARTILDHKKSMIKVLADLWICGYYCRPGIHTNVTQQSSEEKEQQKNKIQEHLRKTMLRDKD